MVQLIPDKNSLASFIPLFTLSLSVINSSLDECQGKHEIMRKDSLDARFLSYQPLLY